MIIESLIRLGRPFLREGMLAGEELVGHITDVASPNMRNFFQNVCLVEIDAPIADDAVRIAGHPRMEWGVWRGAETDLTEAGRAKAKRRPKEVFAQDLRRALGVPFGLPSGGNPLARQGCYPSPVYMVYESSLGVMVDDQEEVLQFLRARAPYTIGWDVSEEELTAIAGEVAKCLPRPAKGRTKTMALIVVIDYRTGLYSHMKDPVSRGGRYVNLAESRLYDGETIVANLGPISDNLWLARLREGEEKGFLKDGSCSICGQTGYVVSSYAKAWPLFSTTYSYPLPQELPENELVKSIGLCSDCYKSLVFGANLFHKTVRSVDRTIAKELFSPTQSVGGKALARFSRKAVDIYGSSYALPVLDGFLRDPNVAADFIASSLERLKPSGSRAGIGLQLEDLLGFETVLSEALASESYRLTIVYYMGNWSQGAVDMLAIIQDVVPSMARILSGICSATGDAAASVGQLISESWGGESGDHLVSLHRRRYASLPYSLILAYGGPYLWQVLDSVLHRRPIPVRPFIRNSARRLQDGATAVSVTGDPVSRRRFQDEVVFLLSFSEFLRRYRAEIGEEGEASPMGDWQEWLGRLRGLDPSSWTPSSASEVGFAAGTVLRAFARQYYRETKKDLIKHRVMTFGADLKPEDIFTKGLSKIQEYAARLDIQTSASLRNAAATVSMGYLRTREEIRKERDAFMAAFWAGYQLCPTDLYPGIGKKDDSHEEEADESD